MVGVWYFGRFVVALVFAPAVLQTPVCQFEHQFLRDPSGKHSKMSTIATLTTFGLCFVEHIKENGVKRKPGVTTKTTNNPEVQLNPDRQKSPVCLCEMQRILC